MPRDDFEEQAVGGENGGAGRALTPFGAAAAGVTERQGFGTLERTRSAELAAQATAAAAQAQIQARYIMALQRPRSYDAARLALLRDCKRTSFADQAMYSLPRRAKDPATGQWINKAITGPTARFAEAAARAWGNVGSEANAIYDDAETETVQVTATDFEANVAHSVAIRIAKTVERSDAKGREVLGTRINSYGRPVYIVRATDDELLARRNAAISRAKRNELLRLIPGDLIDEAKEQIRKTLAAETASDPDKHRKQVCDRFAELGVQPRDLVAYLGHDIGAASPAELADLRGIFAALKDGETTWRAIVEARSEEDDSGGGSKLLGLLRERQAEKEQRAAAGPPPAKVPPKAIEAAAATPPALATRAAAAQAERASAPEETPATVGPPAAAETDEHPTLEEGKEAVRRIQAELAALIGNDKAAWELRDVKFQGCRTAERRRGVVAMAESFLVRARAIANGGPGLTESGQVAAAPVPVVQPSGAEAQAQDAPQRAAGGVGARRAAANARLRACAAELGADRCQALVGSTLTMSPEELEDAAASLEHEIASARAVQPRLPLDGGER